jgi:hypothetical protein
VATEIEVPEFEFASMYYGQILDALVAYKRANIPEHTDESPYDPLMQILRMISLVGHLNNTLIDMVANESTLPTAKLQETVRNMLRLISYELQSATPSTVEVIYELTKVFLTDYDLIPTRAQLSTEAEPGETEVYFEVEDAMSIERTDQLGCVLSYVQDKGPSLEFEDHTTAANDQTPGTTFDPWERGGTPHDVTIGDCLHFGHPQVMWDVLTFDLNLASSGITWRWEFYDGNFVKSTPDSVEDLTGALKMPINQYLGDDPLPGTKIRVMFNQTAYYEDVYSQWNGTDGNFVETTGYLGQTIPSTDEEDYSVGSDWEPLTNLTDGTSEMTVDGKVEFLLPQTLTQNWKVGTVNAQAQYWIRARVVQISTPIPPVLEYVRMDEGYQYVLRTAVQGRTMDENPFASSDGTANQEFQSSQEYFIDGSGEVWVDDELWAHIDNFLSSRPTDKHYHVQLGLNDRAVLIFGDGVTGKIPPAGINNIRFRYRYNAEVDGNVGANSVTQNKSGLSYVNRVWNPRPATGWAEAEGSTPESLERAKVAGPASLRAMEVALNGDDMIQMAIAWEASDGTSPVSRARAFEEGFGPKTVELIVVAGGGGLLDADHLAELETHFNGNQYAYPPIKKRVVANQEVRVTNYSKRTIDIVATVYGKAGVTVEGIENQLARVVQPEAIKDDGVNYEWDFGTEVPTSRIVHEIFEAHEGITKVTLTTPSANVSLDARELPALGTVSITLVIA